MILPRLLAAVPALVATLTWGAWVSAQETPISSTQSDLTSTPIAIEGLLTADTISSSLPQLETRLQPAALWPQPGAAPAFGLLDYPGVAAAAQTLLTDEYPDWLTMLGEKPEAQTLPQNLLQATGCLQPCESQKSLLIVNPQQQQVYVAMVEEGQVIMRPSLMSWPDAAITPLKKWLATSTHN